MLHENYFERMEKAWEWSGGLKASMKRFSKKLITWNRDTFSNIF